MGEVGGIKHYEKKRLPLKWRTFRERSNFPRIWFRDLRIDFEVPKSSIWKHTTSCDMNVFSFIIISQLRRPIEFKLSQVCYFMHTCMLRYNKCEDWSMTITKCVQCLWVQVFTGLLFYACRLYVEIQQVRRLVYDNYQMCPVPLSSSFHRFVILCM